MMPIVYLVRVDRHTNPQATDRGTDALGGALAPGIAGHGGQPPTHGQTAAANTGQVNFMRTVRTIDKQFVTEDSLLQRLRRDVRLLLRIARMILDYFTIGARTRRLYWAKQARSEIFWVDEEL